MPTAGLPIGQSLIVLGLPWYAQFSRLSLYLSLRFQHEVKVKGHASWITVRPDVHFVHRSRMIVHRMLLKPCEVVLLVNV